jgi:hypothetical protein
MRLIGFGGFGFLSLKLWMNKKTGKIFGSRYSLSRLGGLIYFKLARLFSLVTFKWEKGVFSLSNFGI